MTKIVCTILVVVFCAISGFAQIDHSEISFISKELLKSNISVSQIYVTDHYTSQGITHTYFKEAIQGIPVFNSRGAVHYKDKSSSIVKTKFIKRDKSSQIFSTETISVKQAIRGVAEVKGLSISDNIETSRNARGAEKQQVIIAQEVSRSPINAKLQYLNTESGDLKLVWEFALEDLKTSWLTDYLIDAATGEILMEIDWTVSCNHGEGGHDEKCTLRPESKVKANKKSSSIMVPNTYEVFAWPVESPNFGARTVENSPWLDNAVASPNGWHMIGANSYTTTRGNNTDTYLDDDNTNSPTGGDAARADGGADLEFVFDLDVNMDPVLYQDAAVTNCFYWANLMHDVWFNYGFDEQSGNFQEENYTANGDGSDYLYSEVQDGSGTCNANFGTPPDGSNPRMQMYLCTMNGLNRDGDYDNGVIAHEYGHGVSNRLTGGPAASGCLGNQEQMGEGWSDYLGMVMTIETGDNSTDSRGVGTWLFGEGPAGGGIRPYPYSTDFGVNPSTYDDVKTFSVPHGVGSVWCTMLWDMTWAFIDEYGFDADIYNGIGGNNMAMQLVMEGMKLQPCSPGFTDGRDAILQADIMLNEGVNECLIWKAFADRGLGFSADQGSTGSRADGAEAFDLPPSCSLSINKSTVTTSATETNQITYTLVVSNNLPETDLTGLVVTDSIPDQLFFISANGGGTSGTESGGIITFPAIDLLSGESETFTIVLEVKTGLAYINSDIYDDMESGAANWNVAQTGSTNWSLVTTAANSGTTSWFAPDNATTGTAYLDLAVEVGLNGQSELSFYHSYDTEATWDGGQVLLSVDGGSKYLDLGPNMTSNGYNSIIFNSIPGFSGNSGGFVNTQIDLSSYAGQSVIIRFQMNCDQAVGGNGWWIDDFVATNLSLIAINKAAVENIDYKDIAFSSGVEIIPPATAFQAELSITEITCAGSDNGMVTVMATGGSGTYTYLWDDGDTGSSKSNLAPGIYIVTVSDGVDEIARVAITNDPEGMNFNFVTQDVNNVDGDNGSIDLTVSGGDPGYLYTWSNGESTEDISGLAEGIYTVTVTDDLSCAKIESVEVFRYTCGDSVSDSGGTVGDYSNNENLTTVICPDSPDEAIIVTFNSFAVEADWDALYVHNGDNINKPIFASTNPETDAGFPAGGYYGSANPGPFASTDESGCITLRFLSDAFVTDDGWDVSLACGVLCSEEVTKLTDDGWGSLRRTIECADPIDIVPVSVNLDMDSISLSSKILIDKEVVLNMPDGNIYNIIISGLEPIFEIAPAGSLELDNVRLLPSQLSSGAAIINNGTLITNDIEVLHNENTPDPNSLILNNGTMNVRGETKLIKEE